MKEAIATSVNTDYLNGATPTNIDHYHTSCRKWLSEIGYWKDELKFLHSLAFQVSANLADENERIEMRFLNGELIGNLPVELNYLKKKTLEVESMLANVIKHPYVMNKEKCEKEFRYLRLRVRMFRNNFRDVKRRLFRLKKRTNEINSNR